MPDIGEDFENLVNGGYLLLAFLLVGVIVYVAYEVKNAVDPASAGDALSQMWDDAIGAKPVASGPQGSTPTTPFWSNIECWISFGDSCMPASGPA